MCVRERERPPTFSSSPLRLALNGRVLPSSISCQNGNALASPLVCAMEALNATHNPCYNLFSMEEAPFPHVPPITVAYLMFSWSPYPNNELLCSRHQIMTSRLHSSECLRPVLWPLLPFSSLFLFPWRHLPLNAADSVPWW